ncbi:uncharacterized protein LOC111084383, partial [Limulus polyphemus]|uniref:Uncharacterized protein LOC111084383 n=1 Tax=Limulus polyphemus TaxID=6850 RepID=A0ABM1RZL3_LIMPO
DIQSSPAAAMERVLTTVSIESEKQKEAQPLPLVDSTPIRVPTKRPAETTSGPGRPPEKRRPGRPPLHPNVQAPVMEKESRTERQSPTGGGLHLPVLKAEKTLTAQVSCLLSFSKN